MAFRLCEIIQSKNVDCVSSKVDRTDCVIVAVRVSSLREVPFSENALDRMSSSSRKNRIENLCHLKGRLVVLLLVLDIDIVSGIMEGGSVTYGRKESRKVEMGSVNK